MDSLCIEGAHRLKGTVDVPRSKNAALPLMCLTLMTDGPVRLRGLPKVSDIRALTQILELVGVQEVEPGLFNCKNITAHRAPYDLVRKLRASILLLGPMLARHKKAEISLPGGCAIGQRPVDIHLKGLRALGAKIEIINGYIHAEAEQLKGTRFDLGFPTVTGTINLVAAAVLAVGDTILENVAKEPEIVEICEALNKMGARIEGHGSSIVRIQGVDRLGALDWEVQSDRIQALTYLAAAAITGGEVCCETYKPGSMSAVLQKFKEMGCVIEEGDSKVCLKAPERLSPIEIKTAPFPGFPTDAQAQFMACAALADGTSRICETVFENRFQHVSELNRLGAKIEVKGNTATVQGVDSLTGASVMASDLRASASLVLAGLAAKGKTQVLRVYHLDRGYENIEGRLSALGANIWREKA